jgi:predicted RND superfamily exporter protein
VYVNHKIYFVDRVHELTKRGMDWRAAIRQAGIDRVRPVVLTALTAMLGLLPLTLGGTAVFASFGWVNIFGLATSIPLSLILLPALLALPYRFGRGRAASATIALEEGSEIGQETLVMANRPRPASHTKPPPSRPSQDQLN